MNDLIPDDTRLNEIFRQLSKNIPEFNPEAIKLWLQLVGLSNQTSQVFENHFRQWDFSQGRFAILMLLFHQPDENWTPVKLAKAGNVTKATLTGLLKKLTRDGYILSEADENDKRKTVLSLSDSGKEFLESMMPSHFQQISVIFNNFSKEDLAKTSKVLEHLKQALQSKSNKGGISHERR